MEQKQLLLRLLRKAEKAGYKNHLGWLPLIVAPRIKKTLEGEQFLLRFFWPRRFEIIYSHDFAKAIFGEKDLWAETKCTCGGVDFHIGGFDAHRPTCKRVKASRGYKFHLGKMVVEEDPFLYLENFCGE